MNNNKQEASAAEARQTGHSSVAPATFIQYHLIEKIFTTVWLLLRYVFWGWVAYVVYLSVKELAGQKTVASFIFGLFTDNEQSGGVATKIWIFVSALFFVWAKTERWLRLRKVSHMSERTKELEMAIDPGRTSSGLTKAGETPIDERGPL